MTRLDHERDPAEGSQTDQEALAWVVRLTSGEATAEDHGQFRRWRDQHPTHAQALHGARTLWSQLGVALPEIGREQEAATSRRRPVAWSLAIAASLALAVGLGYEYWTMWRFDVVTVAGERRSVTLADGSRVVLGANSAFTVHSDNTERRIALARGQAFFSINPDPRPFVVRTRDAEMRDIGTAFNVALIGDKTRVVVIAGIVEVSDGRRRTRVAADQAIDISLDALGTVGRADGGIETAWMSGRFIAADKSLSEIVESIAPYHSRRVLLLSQRAAQMRINAAIDLNQQGVDEWLGALDRTDSVRLTFLPGLVIVR